MAESVIAELLGLGPSRAWVGRGGGHHRLVQATTAATSLQQGYPTDGPRLERETPKTGTRDEIHVLSSLAVRLRSQDSVFLPHSQDEERVLLVQSSRRSRRSTSRPLGTGSLANARSVVQTEPGAPLTAARDGAHSLALVRDRPLETGYRQGWRPLTQVRPYCQVSLKWARNPSYSGWLAASSGAILTKISSLVFRALALQFCEPV